MRMLWPVLDSRVQLPQRVPVPIELISEMGE
jgi:hypothetical protein